MPSVRDRCSPSPNSRSLRSALASPHSPGGIPWNINPGNNSWSCGLWNINALSISSWKTISWSNSPWSPNPWKISPWNFNPRRSSRWNFSPRAAAPDTLEIPKFPEQRSGRNPGNGGGAARTEPGGAGIAAGDVPEGAPGKTGAEFQRCPEEETPPLGILSPGKAGGGGGDSRLIPIPEFGSWSPFLAAVPGSDPWIPAF